MKHKRPYSLGFALLLAAAGYFLTGDYPLRFWAGSALVLLLYLMAGVIKRETRWLAATFTLVTGCVAVLVFAFWR